MSTSSKVLLGVVFIVCFSTGFLIDTVNQDLGNLIDVSDRIAFGFYLLPFIVVGYFIVKGIIKEIKQDK